MKHLDCRNYAPVDVVKGICHLGKTMVAGDEEGCEKHDRFPRCKFCEKFSPGREEHLGNCLAVETEPMTYPDLSGSNCEFFSWKKG